MDLTFSDRETAFRDELRTWFADNSPARSPPTTRTRTTRGGRDFQRRLAARTGARGRALAARVRRPRGDAEESAIFFEELGRSGAPLPANVLGVLLAGPTIMTGAPRSRRSASSRRSSRPTDLVPGLLRARCRLGPRRAEDARGRRR